MDINFLMVFLLLFVGASQILSECVLPAVCLLILSPSPGATNSRHVLSQPLHPKPKPMNPSTREALARDLPVDPSSVLPE